MGAYQRALKSFCACVANIVAYITDSMGEHDADVVANKDWIEGYEDTGKVIPDVFKVLRVMTDNEIAQVSFFYTPHSCTD